MALNYLEWKHLTGLVDEFLIFRKDTPFEEADFTTSSPLIVGNTKEYFFKDFAIKAHTTYYYVIAATLDGVISTSTQVILTTGEEGNAELTWNPLDKNCKIYIDSSCLANSEIRSIGSDNVVFKEEGNKKATIVDNSISMNGSYFTAMGRGNILNGSSNCTLFALTDNPNQTPGESEILFFTSANRPMLNAFSLFKAGTNSRSPETWIRNLGWTSNIIHQKQLGGGWAFYTMFANWTSGLTGLSVIHNKVSNSQTLQQDGSVFVNNGENLAIGTDLLRFGINLSIKCIILLEEEWTPELQSKLEGWAAWNYNLVDELPKNHKFKLTPPQKDLI